MNYNTVIAAIPAPDYKEHLVKKYQNTVDIISDLLYCFKLYNYQAATVSKLVRTGNIKTDSKNIYDFIKNNITYKAEPFTKQTTASFSRIIHNKQGDCKHSALIVGALGYNMGYNVLFRFVSYDKDKSLGHVYALLQDPKTKEKIIVDPLQPFNYEKTYTKKKDYLAINKTPNNMALSRLSGTEENSIQRGQISVFDPNSEQTITMTPFVSDEKIGQIEMLEGIGKGKLKAAVKKVATQVKSAPKSAAKKVASKIKEAPKKHGPIAKKHIVKKIALAPVRAAFDVLLFFNAKDIAGRLSHTNQVAPDKVKSLATKFGYDYNILSKNIANGAKKKSIGDIQHYNDASIGIAIPASVVAATAVAAPILIATIPLLQSVINKKHPTDASAVKEAIENVKNLPDATVEPTATDSTTTTANKYMKPLLFTLGGATVLYFGGKQMGWFGKK